MVGSILTLYFYPSCMVARTQRSEFGDEDGCSLYDLLYVSKGKRRLSGAEIKRKEKKEKKETRNVKKHGKAGEQGQGRAAAGLQYPPFYAAAVTPKGADKRGSVAGGEGGGGGESSRRRGDDDKEGDKHPGIFTLYVDGGAFECECASATRVKGYSADDVARLQRDLMVWGFKQIIDEVGGVSNRPSPLAPRSTFHVPRFTASGYCPYSMPPVDPTIETLSSAGASHSAILRPEWPAYQAQGAATQAEDSVASCMCTVVLTLPRYTYSTCTSSAPTVGTGVW